MFGVSFAGCATVRGIRGSEAFQAQERPPPPGQHIDMMGSGEVPQICLQADNSIRVGLHPSLVVTTGSPEWETTEAEGAHGLG